jgi:uncharacterized protein
VTLRSGDAVASELVQAIHTGDIGSLQRLVGEHEGLASARIQHQKRGSRTPLHGATDWPGYFPNGPAVVQILIEAGADPNAPTIGGTYSETPLHWAASSDDVDVADALMDGGADVEALGASIAGGAPLDDAVGYGCWNVARRLVERGARVDKLWHASALGILSRVEELLNAIPSPSEADINDAFWHGVPRWPTSSGRIPSRQGSRCELDPRLLRDNPVGRGQRRSGYSEGSTGHLAMRTRCHIECEIDMTWVG